MQTITKYVVVSSTAIFNPDFFFWTSLLYSLPVIRNRKGKCGGKENGGLDHRSYLVYFSACSRPQISVDFKVRSVAGWCPVVANAGLFWSSDQPIENGGPAKGCKPISKKSCTADPEATPAWQRQLLGKAAKETDAADEATSQAWDCHPAKARLPQGNQSSYLVKSTVYAHQVWASKHWSWLSDIGRNGMGLGHKSYWCRCVFFK